MKRERIKAVEQATNASYRKIGDASALARIRADTFASKIRNFNYNEQGA